MGRAARVPIALIAGHRDGQDTVITHLSFVADQVERVGPLWQTAQYAMLAQALAAERVGQPGEAATGDDAAASAAADAAAQEAQREHLPLFTAVAGHCQGLVAGDLAPVLAAASYFQAAGRPLDQALALEDAAGLAAVRGDIQGARQAFGTAMRLYAGLDAVWDMRRADTRLRPYGLRRARGAYRTRAATR